MEDLLKKYYKYIEEQKHISSTITLLQVDQENWMPTGNTKHRSEQLAYFSKLFHQKRTDKEFVNLVVKLNEMRGKIGKVDARSVEVSKRSIDRDLKLPSEFVEEFSRTTSMAQEAWVEARKKSDFSIFEKILGKIFDLSKRRAEYIDKSKPIYDVLVDEFEEGMTEEKIKSIFDPLRDELIEMIDEIGRKKNSDFSEKVYNPFSEVDVGRKTSSATGGWPAYQVSGNSSQESSINQLKAISLVKQMTKQMGFDYDRGQIGVVQHPFEESLSPDDVRIHISFLYGLDSAITGGIHELGHGLYEQYVDSKYSHTELSNGVSLGIHESQSRLVENMIGRSEAFWKWALPLTQAYFDEAKEWQIEDVLNYLNRVQPSLIRIEADEMTYNLHIIIRFEIETAVLRGDIKIKDIPEAWNSKYKEYLGVDVPNDASGCLQDVHWAFGIVGYFPTYTLGNLNAAMLWKEFQKDNPEWEARISKGDFTSYINWFRDNVWGHGSMYKPIELMERITGSSANAKELTTYLRNKYM